MKPILSLLLGSPFVYLFVINPLISASITSLSVRGYGDSDTSLRLLSTAHNMEPYNNKILMLMGDISNSKKNYRLALWAYSEAIKNNPLDAILRAKYGEVLYNLGFTGLFAYKEAVKIEPNHPIFKSEVERITKLLQTSQLSEY